MGAELLLMDERLRLEFNEWARAGRGEGMERGHRPTGAQAIERMSLTEHSRVLDVGCGNGWASRLMGERATAGRVVGIDVSDEMIELAKKTSEGFRNVEFYLGSAQQLTFADGEFTHAFSMESIYYYVDMLGALSEVRRVLAPGGSFHAVVDLYQENEPSHQWIEQLNVPVHLLSIEQYRDLLTRAGFAEVIDERLYDPSPIPEDYTGGSFKTLEDYLLYRQTGSLMLSGRVRT